MERVSRNYVTDGRVENFEELLFLADNKKSVAYQMGYTRKTWFVRPAAFMVQWPLAQLRNMMFFRIKRIEE